VELVYGLWPAVPGVSVQVAGFSLAHSVCAVTVQTAFCTDMITGRKRGFYISHNATCLSGLWFHASLMTILNKTPTRCTADLKS
jgi:hypothetical protein